MQQETTLYWYYFDKYYIVFFIKSKYGKDITKAFYINVWENSYKHIGSFSKDSKSCIFEVIIKKSLNKMQELDIMLYKREILPIIKLYLSSDYILSNRKISNY